MEYGSYYELATHPFVKDVFNVALEFQKELDRSSLYSVKVDLKRNPSEEEYYCLVLGTSLAHYLTTIQQLEHSILFMSNFSPTELMKENGVTRATHLIWASENFIIRTQSAYDRLLVLIDRLFNIQNQANRINHESIVTNGHIAATKIPSLLKPVKNSVKKYYFERNTIIHEAPYHDDELRWLEGMSILVKNQNLLREESEGIEEEIRFETRRYLKNKKREYKRVTENLCKSTASAFSEMHNIFTNKRKELAELC